MKKSLKYVLSLIVAVICLGVTITAGIFIMGDKESKKTINNLQQQIVFAEEEEDTGAADADASLKGGAIYVGPHSTYEMTGGVVSGHTQKFGGAVYVEKDGLFRMTGGVISGNQAEFGGAIYVESGGTVEINGGIIKGNKAEKAPAIYVEPNAKLIINGVINTELSGSVSLDDIVNEEDYSTFIKDNYYDLYSYDVNYYVGNVKTSINEVMKYQSFNVKTSVPITDYSKCCGYFLDDDYMYSIERYEDENGDVRALKLKEQIDDLGLLSDEDDINIYTKEATLGKLTFTEIEGKEEYAVSSNSATGKVVVPRLYNGKIVTQISATAFNNNKNITEVTIPATIYSIGTSAFQSASLSKMNIPDCVVDGVDVITLGDFAFAYAPLTSMIVSGEVKTLPTACFYGSKIKSVTLNEGIEYIRNSAFDGCSALTELTIPDSVREIGRYCFQGCSSVTKLTLGKNIEKLGSFTNVEDNANYGGTHVFNGCIALTEVHIRSLENWCKVQIKDSNCAPLKDSSSCNLYFDGSKVAATELVIPGSVEQINAHAFYNFTKLKKLIIPDSVVSVSTLAFTGAANITDLTIGKGLNGVKKDMFGGCSKLVNLKCASLMNSEVGAFQNISTLQSVELTNVTNVSYSAFYGCVALTDVVLPNGLTEICDTAFGGCTGLTSIKLPTGLRTIGDYSFKGCTSLASIEFPESCKTIASYAFWGSGLKTVHIGGINTIGAFAFYECESLVDLHIPSLEKWCAATIGDNGNPMKYAENIYFDGDVLPCKELVIPSNVTVINPYVFNYMNIPSVVIGDYVSKIMGSAFKSAEIESLKIGSHVEEIGDYAFSQCDKLSIVEIPDNVKVIGKESFSNCDILKGISLGAGIKVIEYSAFSNNPALKTVSLNESITTIGDYAFARCTGLTSIEIPKNVHTIGTWAFSDCENLVNIKFLGNKLITMGSNAFAEEEPKLTNVYITELDFWYNVNFGNGAANPLRSAQNLYVDNVLTNELTITSDIPEIKAYSFYYFKGLETLNIQDLITIDSDAFFGAKIKHLNVGTGVDGISKGDLGGLSVLETITTNSVLGLFNATSSLKSITLLDNVTEVKELTFHDCKNVETITISDKLTSVGEKGLATYPYSIVTQKLYIPNLDFWYNIDFASGASNPLSHATELYVNDVLTTEITIPSNIGELKPYVFYGFKGLETLNFESREDSNPLTIGTGAFYSAKIKHLNIGTGFDGISKTDLDNGLTALESVTTNSKLGTFQALRTIKEVTFLDDVTEVDDYTFFDCRAVETINLTSHITTVGDWAFNSCLKVEELVLPEGLQTIGESAFRNMIGLKRLYMPASLTRIDSSAFAYNYYIKELHIASFEKWFEIDFVSAYSTPMYYADRVYIDGSTTNTDTITIPSSISEIKQYAISGTAIKYITIPETVTTIRSFAFSDSGVISLVLPSTITTIEKNTFDWCMGLGAIYIPSTVTEILAETYSESPFNYCVNRNINIFTEYTEENIPETWSAYWNVYSGETNAETSEVTAYKANTIYGASIETFNAFVESDFDIQLLKQDPKFVYTDGVVYGYTAKEEYPIIPEGVTGMSSTAFNQTDDAIYGVYIPESLVNIAVSTDSEGRTVGPFGMAMGNTNYEFTVYLKSSTIPEGFAEGWDIAGYDADGNAIKVTVVTGIELEDFKAAIDFENVKTFAPAQEQDIILNNDKKEEIILVKNKMYI